MNLERILQHRGVILIALRGHEAAVNEAKKKDEKAEIPTNEHAKRLAIVEELIGEFELQVSMGIEGTPMGDAVAAQVFKALDGTALDVGALDEMLRSISIDVPPEAISAWTLEERRVVHQFVHETLQWKLKAAPGDVMNIDPPEFFEDAWFLGDDEDDEALLEKELPPDEIELLEKELPPDEIEQWLGIGPWRVEAADASNPASDEWAIRRPTDKPNEVIAHPQKYGQLDRARLIAANLNAIERGRTEWHTEVSVISAE